MEIREIRTSDHPEWFRMRLALWPGNDAAEEERDIADWLARVDAVVLVAERSEGGLAGFVEVGTRPYADGCDTTPVAFLEGWYVDSDVRRQGFGTALLHAAEDWARSRGLREFASDALLDNVVAHRAHESLGFTEVERAVRYRKTLAFRRSEL